MDAVILRANVLRHGLTSRRLDGGQCDCDCDCACVSSPPRAALIDLTDSPLVVSDVITCSVLSGWHGLHGSSMTDAPVVLSQPVYDLWREFQNARRLDTMSLDADRLSLVHDMVAMGLLRPSLSVAATQRIPDSQLLTSWLHLTDRCNLRCSYCYLPHVREEMSPETGFAAIDATFRSAVKNGFRQVKIKYAGGEPLMRFPMLVELHAHAQTLAKKHGIELEGVVLSNGTLLTVEKIGTLKSLGLRLMISLDGLGSFHDSHRPYAGGRGSFADVSEAVDLALSMGLTPNLSVTVSSRTAEGLPDVLAWMLERDLPFSLNFYRENELSASQKDMRLDEQKIIDGMQAAFRVIEENLPRRPFLGGIIDRANLSIAHAYTCGVGQNYLVFDQNGLVAKCQMYIRKPVTDVHVADPLTIVRADQIGIQNLPVDEKEDCTACEWKNWCAGGCPLETYRITGRYDVRSPNCNIYKALFPHALRLEGLRLLKYKDDPEVVTKYA